MDAHDRHVAIDFAKLVMAFAAIIVAVCMVVLTVWLVTAKQDSKLYEADSMVCASQPFSMQCWERKPR
jgi:hypothetical protein